MLYLKKTAALLLSVISFVAVPCPCQLVGASLPFQDGWWSCCSVATHLAVSQNMSTPSWFAQMVAMLCPAFCQLQVLLLLLAPAGWKPCEWQEAPKLWSFFIWGHQLFQSLGPSDLALLFRSRFSLFPIMAAMAVMVMVIFFISASIVANLLLYCMLLADSV